MTNNTIIITTGGSGGHMVPAESIAKGLIDRGFKIVFMTDKRGNSFKSLKDVHVIRLSASSITGKNIFGKIMGAASLLLGCVQAFFYLKKIHPLLVVGVGGYASIPTVMAAHMWRIPVVLNEQNAVLGRSNRILAKGALFIATAFPKTQCIPAEIPTFYTGLPVRTEITQNAGTPFPTTRNGLTVLIFAGSQGSRFFTHKLASVLCHLPPALKKKLILYIQARPEDIALAHQFYDKAGFKKTEIKSFFTNIPTLLTKSHLLIGRAGASTLIEAGITGRPVITIPLPSAADNHQLENARLFCKNGAGWLWEEKNYNQPKWTDRLAEILTDTPALQQAARQALANGKLEAGDKIAALITDVLKGQPHKNKRKDTK